MAFLLYSPKEKSSIPGTIVVKSVLLCTCLVTGEGLLCVRQHKNVVLMYHFMGPCQWDESFQDGIMAHACTKALFRLSCRKEGEESSTTNPDNWISGFEQPGSSKGVNLLPWGWKPRYKENATQFKAFSWKSEESSKVLGNGCAKHAWRSWCLNSWSGKSPGVTGLCTVSFNDARSTGSWNTRVPNSTLVLEGCLENEQHFPSSWRAMSLKPQIWVKPAGRIPIDHRELQP